MKQTSLDLQYTLDSWLLKFEGFFRSNSDEDFTAFVSGFEYSFYGLIGPTDLGLLAEYNFDSRGSDSVTGLQNDLFTGLRWVMNDSQSSELLFGLIFDLEASSKLLFLEVQRRLNDRWSLSFEVRAFIDTAPDDFFFTARQDSFTQLEATFFF